jgi:transcriptional regulator GlxA family with amidase domain
MRDRSEYQRISDQAAVVVVRHLGDRDLNLQIVSGELNVSPRTLQRALAAIRGETFSAYLERVRLERALALLRSDPGLAVRIVADNVGYGSGAALAKAIRRRYGERPSVIRAAPSRSAAD